MKDMKIAAKKMGRMIETFGCEILTDYISKDKVRAFEKLDLGTRVLKVKRRSSGLTGSGVANRCHQNVGLLVENFGGRHIMGFALLHFGSGIGAVWHSVWVTPEGVAVDPTLHANEMETLLAGEEKNEITYTDFIPVTERSDYVDVYGENFLVMNDVKTSGVIVIRNKTEATPTLERVQRNVEKRIPLKDFTKQSIYEVITKMFLNKVGRGEDIREKYVRSLEQEGGGFLRPSPYTNKHLVFGEMGNQYGNTPYLSMVEAT